MNKTKVFEAKIKPLVEQVLQACDLYEIPAVAAFAVPVEDGMQEVHVAAYPEEGSDMPALFVGALTALAGDDEAAHAEIEARYGPESAPCDGNCSACAGADKEDEQGESDGAARAVVLGLLARLQATSPEKDSQEHLKEAIKRLDTLKGLAESLQTALSK